jgi:2TM domain
MRRGPAGGRLSWEVMEMAEQQLPLDREDLRERAVARLKQRRDFGAHLFVYLVVNAFLVRIWAFIGGFFWPAIPWACGASGWS